MERMPPLAALRAAVSPKSRARRRCAGSARSGGDEETATSSSPHTHRAADARRRRTRGRRRTAQPLHQSAIAEPHVKPEPNATIAIFEPRFSRPSCSASASKIGIVAAVVLP